VTDSADNPDTPANPDKAVVIAVEDFNAALTHMTRTLGFRVDRISPADDPREADVSGHGLSVVLRRTGDPGAANLDHVSVRTLAGAAGGATSQPGMTLESVVAERHMALPDGRTSLQVSRLAESSDFAAGRAGMGYRDLIPDRQGGRFIASHIRIAGGGEVPDYAHFHKIRFQMIYCYRGWVRVVYEDQGDPFVLEAGDCVLQPPEIRHRVLESSPGLEVIEIGCPAEHDTFADHNIVLPTGVVQPERNFGGQRFVHHIAAQATWTPWTFDGFEHRDLGIGDATDGLAGVRVVRPTGGAGEVRATHGSEFVMFFVLEGTMCAQVDGAAHELVAGDSIVVPAESPFVLQIGPDSELLEVTLPAVIART
jgi:quercetin dioxygenase-like cupin family protein